MQKGELLEQPTGRTWQQLVSWRDLLAYSTDESRKAYVCLLAVRGMFHGICNPGETCRSLYLLVLGVINPGAEEARSPGI